MEDVFLGSSEFSGRVMGLVSLLLHCNASNLQLQSLKLKRDKILGTICISIPHSEFRETHPQYPPTIYAHGDCHTTNGHSIILNLLTFVGKVNFKQIFVASMNVWNNHAINNMKQQW